MPLIADRVAQTTTATGDGAALNITGGAKTGYRTFGAGIGFATSCYYAIVHQSSGEWEVGLGTVTSGSPDVLNRTTVLAGTAGAGTRVNFSAGTKDVFVTAPADKLVVKDAAGAISGVIGSIEMWTSGLLAVARGGAGTTTPRDNVLAAAAKGEQSTTGIQLGNVVTLVDAGLRVADVISVWALASGTQADTQTRVKLRFRDAATATISDFNGNTVVGLSEVVTKNEAITIPAATVDILVGSERVGGGGAARTRQHVVKLMTL